MSSRTSYALAVLVLLAAAALRIVQLTTLPPGFHADEINDIRITETVRQGRVEVFYNLGTEGREGMYQTLLSVVTAGVGGGQLGYRAVSLFAGLLSLAVVYALVKRLYNPMAALAAMTLLAVGMWPILLSRVTARESILPFFVAGVLLSLAHALRIPPRHPFVAPSTTPFTTLALLLGLGFYVHPVGFVLALMAMLLIAYALLSRQQMTRRMLGYIGYAILVMIILVVPYLLSSVRHPHLAGQNRLFEGFAVVRPTPLRALVNGLGGFFLVGDQDPLRNLPGRPLVDIVSGVFMSVGLVVCLRYVRQARFAMPVIAALILAPVALLSATSPNFESMTVLLPLVALFFGVGVSAVCSSLRREVRPIMTVGLLALLTFNVIWTVRDLFTVWPNLPAVQTAYNGRLSRLAHHLDRTAGATPGVICVRSLESFSSPGLESYEILALMMHRQSAMLRYAECLVNPAMPDGASLIFARGGDREQLVFLDGEIPETMPEPLQAWFSRGVILDSPDVPPRSVLVLDEADLLADTVGRFTTTAPVLYPPEAPGQTPLTYPPVRFGDNLTFLGYERFDDRTYRPGDLFLFVTYWRVDGVLPSNLQLFTHVLTEPFSIASQKDILSVLPSQLQPRDVFMQLTYVRLPRVMQPGEYSVSIGAYKDVQQDTLDERLIVYDHDAARGNRLILPPITVANS